MSKPECWLKLSQAGSQAFKPVYKQLELGLTCLLVSWLKPAQLVWSFNPCNCVLYTHNICTHFPDVIVRNSFFAATNCNKIVFSSTEIVIKSLFFTLISQDKVFNITTSYQSYDVNTNKSYPPP